MEMASETVKLTREETGIDSEGPFDFLHQESIFSKYKFGMVGTNAPFKLFESNCSTSGDEDSDDESGDDKRVRGPYRKYTIDQKMQAVERIISGEDVKVISKLYGIPRRNLLRWRKNGCERKQGGGRPTDAEMEKSIYQKIINKELQSQKEIRKYAIELSKTTSFKASKGWFVKFCNRFGIALKSSLQQMENQSKIKSNPQSSVQFQEVQI